MQEYWVAFKNGEYISEIDKQGSPIHTKDKNKAFKFLNFGTAMNYFNSGYVILKVWED